MSEFAEGEVSRGMLHAEPAFAHPRLDHGPPAAGARAGSEIWFRRSVLSAIENGTMGVKMQVGGDEEMGWVGGPAVLTPLSETTATGMGWRNLSGMRAPRVCGDVIALAVDAFKSG